MATAPWLIGVTHGLAGIFANHIGNVYSYRATETPCKVETNATTNSQSGPFIASVWLTVVWATGH